jgi:hypothetical protein
MRRRVRLSRVTIALAVIAAIAIAAPAMGGPSLKKLVKKEVAKQLKNKQGPQGPQGAPGTPGTPGANATALFAAADSDGTLTAQSGVTGPVAHTTGTGQYTIPFDRNIDACAPVATLTNDDPGEILASVLGGANNTVLVVTQDNDGAAADGAFSVAVFC